MLQKGVITNGHFRWDSGMDCRAGDEWPGFGDDIGTGRPGL